METEKNKLLKDLLCVVNIEDVMTADKQGNLFLGGTKLQETELDSLRAEAEFLTNTHLWKILTMSLKEQAMKVMFEQSQTFDDMRAGKMMLYNLSVQENIVNLIKSSPRVVESKEGV